MLQKDQPGNQQVYSWQLNKPNIHISTFAAAEHMSQHIWPAVSEAKTLEVAKR